MGHQHHNKGRSLPVEILTVEEVVALLQACGPNGHTRTLRDRALIALLYGAGLRVSEALKLFTKDINIAGGSIRVLFGKGAGGKSRRKGHQARTVGIDPDSLLLVRDWIDRRAELGLGPLSHLICTYSKPTPGQPVDPSHVRRLLPRLARKAGVTKRVHAHGLRHSIGVQLDNEHVATSLIQRQYGHKSVATTSNYLDHFSGTQVVDAMVNRRPLAEHLAALRGSTEGIADA